MSVITLAQLGFLKITLAHPTKVNLPIIDVMDLQLEYRGFFLPLCYFGKETDRKTTQNKLKFQAAYRICFNRISSSSYCFAPLSKGYFGE